MTAFESLPPLVVELDGRPLDARFAESLAGVRVLQRLSLPSLCELTFGASSPKLADTDSLLPGTPLRVTTADDAILFDGEITGLNHAHDPACQHDIRVRAFDRLHRLRKRQRVRAFPEKTLTALARDLAGDLGIDLDIDDAGPVWPKIVQWRQSDLELLTEVAGRCGLYFTLRGNVLHFVTLGGDGSAVSLELGTSLLEAELDASTEPACRQLEVRAWDPWHALPCDGDASEARSGRRIPLELDPTRVGSPGERTLADLALQDSSQAACVAQAELDRRVAGEVVLKGTAAGDVRLRPGSCVELSGVSSAFSGRYLLTAVTHSLDRESGFRSMIDTSPPPPDRREHGTITTLGHVLDADDPAGLGRVKVSLPTYGGIETDWLLVLMNGAGDGKGLISIPDKDDQVLVLLPRHDPAQGVVLGGLYGVSEPPDTGIENGRVRRYTFMTPGGQRLRLDDERRTARVDTCDGNSMTLSPGRARLADSRGSYVELTDDHVRVHAAADLELEAPGKSIRIRGARIDFQEA